MTLEDYLKDDNSRFATVAMTDTNGLLRGQMVSIASLSTIARDGMGMSPVTLALEPQDVIGEIPGVSDDSADFHDDPLVVDPASVRRLPWSSRGHDLLVLSNYSGDTAKLCPRSLLQSVLQRTEEAGFQPRYGLELEYTLFNETDVSAREKNYRNLDTATLYNSHDLLLYQVNQTDWYESVAAMCELLNINLAKMHEEIGGGFMEACIAAGQGLEPADQLVLLKNFLRALAAKQDKCITYMPRWSEGADSQSMHIHVSLQDLSGESVFYKSDQTHAMSGQFRHFIGGLQKHLGEMSLLFMPTVNSYRRFVEGTFAPPGLSWGFENRTTCFRVVGHDADSLRVENRLPGSDTNPYLTVAATVAAGIDGIVNQIEPEAETLGNGYAQPGGPDFIRTMPEAIERFRASEFAHDWLGEEFVNAFSSTRQSQYDSFAAKIPDVELQRFFDLG